LGLAVRLLLLLLSLCTCVVVRHYVFANHDLWSLDLADLRDISEDISSHDSHRVIVSNLNGLMISSSSSESSLQYLSYDPQSLRQLRVTVVAYSSALPPLRSALAGVDCQSRSALDQRSQFPGFSFEPLKFKVYYRITVWSTVCSKQPRTHRRTHVHV